MTASWKKGNVVFGSRGKNNTSNCFQLAGSFVPCGHEKPAPPVIVQQDPVVSPDEPEHIEEEPEPHIEEEPPKVTLMEVEEHQASGDVRKYPSVRDYGKAL